MRFKLLLFFSFLTIQSLAQEAVIVHELLESNADALPEDFDYSEFAEQLEALKRKPLNLNMASFEDLKTFPLLSPLQAANLFEHIKTTGKLADLTELQAIAGFDLPVYNRILPFVTIDSNFPANQVSFKNALKLSEHEWMLRYAQTIEQQKGFKQLLGSRYLGSPGNAMFRYIFRLPGFGSLSITIDKDAGETYFGTNKKHLDFIAGNLNITRTGRLGKIVIGNYGLQFGQGLTLWSGFSLGKGADVTSVAKKDLGLRPYASTNEFSFFKGIAWAARPAKNLTLTSFGSFRKLDGHLEAGPENELEITAINETGLHRTASELKNKNSVAQKVFGLALHYNLKQLSIGVIGYQTLFDKKFASGTSIYDQFGFAGKNLNNYGFYYNYSFRNFYIFGETAESAPGGFATINGVLISLSPSVSAVALHRNYNKNYHSFFSNAVGENTKNNNENGLYTGINVVPNKHWAMALYADQFTFPWLRYRVDAPSKGHEMLAQLTFTPNKLFKISGRIKFEKKQQNTDSLVNVNFIEAVSKINYRIGYSWKLNPGITILQTGEIVTYQKGSENEELGYLFYQDLQFQNKRKLSGNMRVAYFNTPSYNSRIFAYENDVLYGFSFGSYSGKGYRFFLNLKYQLFKGLALWTRYAMSYYPGQEAIGTGLDEISGNKKQEVKLQLRYQL